MTHYSQIRQNNYMKLLKHRGELFADIDAASEIVGTSPLNINTCAGLTVTKIDGRRYYAVPMLVEWARRLRERRVRQAVKRLMEQEINEHV